MVSGINCVPSSFAGCPAPDSRRRLSVERGSKTDLTDRVFTVTVGHAGGPGAVDVAAVLLGGDGKVRGDEDLVFYNNPKQPGVVLLSEASVGIDLAAVPPGIHRIVVTGSTEAQGRDFGSLGSLTVTVQGHSEGFRFVPDRLSTETVLQVVALYRRNGRGRTGCPARTPTRSRCSSGTA